MDSLLDEFIPIPDEDRFGFSTPVFMICVIIAYLAFVLQIGPRIMKNREPFKLKEFILFYNILQVVACLYAVNEIWNLASWSLFSFKSCHIYEANTVGRKKFDDLTYFIYWLKIFELCDTVVFVMRKKQNQITYLHVFHHSSTITLVYLLLKYYRGNGALYPIFLNSWVHVIMYTYYLFSNICSAEVMKKFILVKKSITIIQMVQFCMILAQVATTWKNCKIPLILRCYYLFVVSVIFYGFYDFYKKAYLTKQAANKSKNKSK